MEITLLQNTPEPEKLIASAARTCYDSEPKDIEKERALIRGLIKSGHESVIEHASASFKLDGVSRVLTHELVRHRLFSFSQRSQRYVKEDVPSYVTPDVLLNANEEDHKLSAAKKLYDTFMKDSWFLYKNLMERGLKPEDARFVLPNACTTEIVVSGNFRQWRNFLKLRLSTRA